jgi:uncharacterized membrane protein
MTLRDDWQSMRISRFKILAGLLLAAGAAFLTFTSIAECIAVTANGAGELGISASTIRSGHAQLFCYTDDAGKRLRFILARGDDGKVRSVFDACRQCATFHRGYRIVNGELICRVCGNHYPLNRMMEGKASCVPVSLAHEGESEVVRIKTADLKAGSSFF